MKNFRATHILRHHGIVEPVMLCDDGGLYDRAEWNACDAADYTLEPDGSVLFQGQPFDGELNMMSRTKQGRTNATPGFATEIKDDTELGLAMLIADLGDGHYQPIGVVVSINEAREIAASDMRGRMRDLEAGKSPACPEVYVIWAQGMEGDYRELKRLMP